ncbi:unnamed protein product [Candidula unifasciata]|uniref:Peroxisomal biogenesis factor 11 n=1 Tax=Candidula unifasciata TaxID=100452 RepID=A0A8S3YJJ3_9EUPU|nr:unnamed protein product [Candidula unifasciata]
MSLARDFIKFSSSTSARDKIFRLAQYGSRLLLWQLTHGSPDRHREVITRLSKLEAALSLSRKLFRLGNCVDLAHKAVDALSIEHPGIRALTVTSLTMKSLWLFIDHFLWFGKVGVMKIDLILWTRWSLRAWLVCLIAASMADVILLLDVEARLHRESTGRAQRTPYLKAQVRSVRLNFWRDVCDVFIPLAGLGYASPGCSALCGVVSSLIGFLQEWERLTRPCDPKT